MSGHNKWSSIKHQKGATDAKRGAVFTKLSREIIIAVRDGGSNTEANFRLRLAMDKARAANMPLDNIDRAIRRGSGELGGATLTELTLEGYGPSGAAIMVQALSDNRNRTIQEVRNIFNRGGGNMGEAGCVAWMFNSKGIITAETNGHKVDDLAMMAIDAGADDVQTDDGSVEIYTSPDALESVKKVLEQNKINIVSAELSMSPSTTVDLSEAEAIQALKLLHKLEDLDEVQNVFSNINFSGEVLEKFGAQ